MAMKPRFARPPFAEALNAWKSILSERGFPDDVLWIFDENLCFEKDPARESGYKLGFQTRFAPPPPDAGRIAFRHFCEFDARIVFYRIGSWNGKSLCLLLCDEWFEPRDQADGFVRRDEWLISFHPGDPQDVEEITDEQRWNRRILRDRPLHDLDFCMSLRAVHEILAHGRALSIYERYALRFLHAWRRLLRETK